MAVRITGLNMRISPRRNKAGDIILANFDVLVGGIYYRQCALVAKRTSYTTIYPPIDSGVRFNDDDLRREIAESAIETFLLLGGELIDAGETDDNHDGVAAVAAAIAA